MNDMHKSIFFSAFERYGSVLFFVFATAILARLLSPEEFGIYAIVNALTAVIGAYFHEFGGANYLIQKSTLSERNIRTAFTVTLIMSLFVAVSLFELRDSAAWFFSQDGLRIGIAISALNFLLTPISVIFSALLRREMAFASLARCNLASNFVTSLSSIALAAAGYSFMAPIMGMLIGNATLTVLLLRSRRDLHILKPCLDGYREVFKFGAYSSAVVIINVFYQWSPQLMLGRILDITAVGLYSRAASITQVFDRLVMQVLNPVIMPAIFAHTRAGGELRSIYLKAIELTSVLQWPFMVFLAIVADTIILLWLGPTWMEIVPLVRVLCIASLALFAASLTYPVLVAVGRIQDTLISSLLSLPPSLIVIFIASFFGVQAVAASALLTLPFQALVAIYFIGRHLSLGPTDLIRATLKSAMVTVCSASSVILSVAATKYSGASPIAELLLVSVFAAAGWGLGLLVTNHPLLGQMRVALSGIALAARASLR